MQKRGKTRECRDQSATAALPSSPHSPADLESVAMTGLQETTNMNHDIIVWKRRWGLNVPKVQVSLSIFGCCPRCWSSSQTITPAHFVWENSGSYRSLTASPARTVHSGSFFYAVAGFGRGALSSPGRGNFNKEAWLNLELDQRRIPDQTEPPLDVSGELNEPARSPLRFSLQHLTGDSSRFYSPTLRPEVTSSCTCDCAQIGSGAHSEIFYIFNGKFAWLSRWVWFIFFKFIFVSLQGENPPCFFLIEMQSLLSLSPLHCWTKLPPQALFSDDVSVLIEYVARRQFIEIEGRHCALLNHWQVDHCVTGDNLPPKVDTNVSISVWIRC